LSRSPYSGSGHAAAEEARVDQILDQLNSMTNCNIGSLAAAHANFGAAAPNLMIMQRSQSCNSTDTLVAMLASCSPAAVAQLQASRSTGSLEDAVIGCGQKRGAESSFYPASAYDAAASVIDEAGDDFYAGGDECAQNVEKKRRLTFDQVRSLERNFGLENKLEPERKLQLAKELGLQPRQVAVWFQNRRARCKTKQLERDYEVLILDYNRLKSELQAVIEEKKELKAKMQWLTGKAQPEEEYSGCEAAAAAAAVEEDVSCKVVQQQGSTTQAWPHPAPGSNNPAALVKPEKLQLEFCNSTRDVNQLLPRSSTFVMADQAPPLRRRKDGSPISSASCTSSEILDADSPRTIDSGLNSSSLQTQLEDQCKPVAYPALQILRSADTLLDQSANAVMNLTESDDVYGRVFSPQPYSNPRSINILRDDHAAAAAAAATMSPSCCFQDQDSSSTYLPATQVEEHGALSWWDWPFANI